MSEPELQKRRRPHRQLRYQEERYHTFTDEQLQELCEKHGDIEAKGVLEDRKIVRDLVCNPQTEFQDHLVPLGPRIWLLFRKPTSSTEDRVVMYLKLEENVTQDDVRHYWWEIEQWQKLLREWAGPEKSVNPRYAYLARLYKKHKEGFSVGELAELVASEALSKLEFLLYHLKKVDDLRRSLRNIETWNDRDTERWVNNTGASLELFRMAGGDERTDEALHEWLRDALKYLTSNYITPIKAPIPITGEQIEGAFKTFRKHFVKKERPEKIR